MKLKSICITMGLLAMLFSSASTFAAGPYMNDLSKCIVESTTPADREMLVRWIFVTVSLHPAIKPLAKVSQKDRETANKQIADLFVNLLTKSCKEKVVKALKYEGQEALSGSFQTLGQVAGQELFNSSEVAAGLEDMMKYVDKEKFKNEFNIN